MFRRSVDPSARLRQPQDPPRSPTRRAARPRPGVCLSAAQLETVACALATATASLPLSRHLCLLPLPTLLENIAGLYAPLFGALPACCREAASRGWAMPGPTPRGCSPASPGPVPKPDSACRKLPAAARACRAERLALPPSLRFVAVGGAAVPPLLLERAAAIGIPVYEGYGLSEYASVVCPEHAGGASPGDGRRPLPHARLRVAEDGEILVSGTTFLGYLGDPPRQPVAELATGDLGALDEEGFVTIRGRRRNMFITSLGRNRHTRVGRAGNPAVRPIRHVMVFGESRPMRSRW